ncbi:MAG: hypothetical protein LBC98_07640 [Prevotellaceae bacterium]|jgi:hypothetical protein|nr:hypothetical protein [Prevotellaceae bacterium]
MESRIKVELKKLFENGVSEDEVLEEIGFELYRPIGDTEGHAEKYEGLADTIREGAEKYLQYGRKWFEIKKKELQSVVCKESWKDSIDKLDVGVEITTLLMAQCGYSEFLCVKIAWLIMKSDVSKFCDGYVNS